MVYKMLLNRTVHRVCSPYLLLYIACMQHTKIGSTWLQYIPLLTIYIYMLERIQVIQVNAA